MQNSQLDYRWHIQYSVRTYAECAISFTKWRILRFGSLPHVNCFFKWYFDIRNQSITIQYKSTYHRWNYRTYQQKILHFRRPMPSEIFSESARTGSSSSSSNNRMYPLAVTNELNYCGKKYRISLKRLFQLAINVADFRQMRFLLEKKTLNSMFARITIYFRFVFFFSLSLSQIQLNSTRTLIAQIRLCGTRLFSQACTHLLNKCPIHSNEKPEWLKKERHRDEKKKYI